MSPAESHVSLSMTASCAKPNIIGLSEVGTAKLRHSRLSSIPEGSNSSSEVAASKGKSIGTLLGKRASAVAKEGADASRAAMWQEVLQATTPPHSAVSSTKGDRAHHGLKGGDAQVSSPAQNTTVQTAMKNAKAVCDKVAQSRILVSLLVFLTTVILLLIINPPMAQEPASPGETPRRSWKKISVWSTIAMLLALILPFTSKTACLGSTAN